MTQNYTLTHLKTTTSTNDDALALGANGAPHLSLVVADTMASGRGRVAVAPAAKEAVFAPVCLADLGINSDASAVIHALCATFLARYNAWETHGFSAELVAYNNVLWQRGAEVRVSLDAAKTQFKTGINKGVRADGALMLDNEAILVGDVS